MAGAYGYSDGAHEAASKHVRDVNGQLQGDLKALESKLDGLRGAWVGTAATSFTALHQRWNADTQKLNNALVAIADLLDSSGSTYAATEDDAGAQMSKIQGALNG